MFNKYHIRDKTDKLDAKTDALKIVQYLLMYEFKWDFNKALELALYKTYAVPSISKILFNSQEFKHNPEKRYDDTDILLSEIIEYGYDSERGKAAIDQMNWIHSHYPITNDDYLYVLSTFIFEVSRWINKFGWRKLTKNEELAGFYVWKEIGTRMFIKDIPDSIEEFELFNIKYENEKFKFTDSNQKVAKYTEDMLLRWYLPKPLREAARPIFYTLMDDNTLQAFGHHKPPKWIKDIVHNSLQVRAKLESYLPRFRPFYRTAEFEHKYYKKTYSIEELGPEKLNKIKLKGCPYHQIKTAMTTSSPTEQQQ
jgi:hypothetical protein